MGNLDCHDQVEVFGVLNLVTGWVTTRSMEQLRTKLTFSTTSMTKDR